MTQSERYAGQVERARAAGLSLPTIESVKQGCYSDEQLSALIDDLAVRAGARTLIFGARFQIPNPSGELRAAKASPGADPCKGMATPAAGDASDSQHGRYSREEALAELATIEAGQGHDGIREADHIEADDVLLKLIGDDEIAAAFERIEKWYA